ncbi:replication termination factor 2-like [Haliotis rufescens]|uniref:replication termination factor 2-like n=1 Tax=Haliotis rufescens TaxID=6454 RepID=UPI001EB028F7|nr:replication termination factor 2-like [Haliotis rufescens]
MGCDGGTIPKRDELVRTKKKPEQKDKAADLVAKWKHCALSQERLVEPIMACELGKLYNRESALEFLLDRSKFECAQSFDHLRVLKDLKKLELTVNRGYEGWLAEKGDSYIDMQKSGYICPVVGLEMNGKYKFCFSWKCGCVVSERALKEVKTDVCHKCGKPFAPEDIVLMNAAEEDYDEMKTKMEARRLKTKMEKKAKKAEKHKVETTSQAAEGEASSSKRVRIVEPAKVESGSSKLTNGLKNPRTKVTNGKVEEKAAKAKSIQEDPTASKAFKSLFTSSDRARNQPKAHWVTFNPMYY